MHAEDRSFLFLQGPHGPFLGTLGAALAGAGARVLRVGFNSADAAAWRDPSSYLPFSAPAGAWPDFLRLQIERRGVTDIVMYGDARPLHAEAAGIAAASGVTVHWLEEGYLRPYWISHEIGGINGGSRLMGLGIGEIRAAARLLDGPLPEAPARWGAALSHAWYGAAYHARILAENRDYPFWRSHRSPGVAREAWLHALRLVSAPHRAVGARLGVAALHGRGRPYHLVLLQLGHDGAFLRHGPFPSVAAFMAHCIAAFVRGAPAGERLVFKTHPFEDMRVPLARVLRGLAREAGIADRVSLVQGGPLGPLLDRARSAVTVNSTAGQQALWRGLPLSAQGRAIYAKPGLASDQPLAAFFADPAAPDMDAYRDFRRFLLATSQVPGSFYGRRGRALAVAGVAGRLLAGEDAHVRLLDRARALGGPDRAA